MTAPTTAQQEPVGILARSAGAQDSGILTAVRGKHRRLICIEDGRVVFVASNMLEEQIDEHLVRKQLLDAARRDELRALAVSEEKTPASLLLEKGWIQPSALTQALEERARSLILSTLLWMDAEIMFQPGRPNLDGEITIRLSCVPLVLDHVRRHPESLDEVRVRIGPPNMRPVTTGRSAELIEEISLSDAARSVLEASDGTRDLSVLLSQSKHSRDEILRPLYAFLMLGFIEAAKEETVSKKKVFDQVGRDEVEARLHQADGADFYMVLGVGSKVTEAEIRSAYYLLARRFHPDRFRTGPLADLLPRIEAYFTQVTEAYNTLSDPERRSQYDEELTQRIVKRKEEPEQDTAYLARENYARARLLLERKRFQEAVRFLENAIQLDDSKAEYHLELGRALSLNPRRRQDAEIHLQRATDLNPTLVPAFIALGELYRRMNRLDDAASAFRAALQWEPENAEAQEALADLG